jgi:hypothetical protein
MRHRRNHKTIKVNHKVHPRLRRHRHRLSLPPPPHPRYLLLLMLILLRQVQQVCSHAPCHCGLVSFFSSAVHLSLTQTVTNTASSGRLSHLLISLLSFRSCSMCVFNFTTSLISILFRTLCRDASILFSSSRWKHDLAANHDESNGRLKSIGTETLTSLRRSITFLSLTGCQMR